MNGVGNSVEEVGNLFETIGCHLRRHHETYDGRAPLGSSEVMGELKL